MPSVPMKRDEGDPIPPEWNLQCLECGYALTGLTNRVCPECGHQFSPRETWEANQAGAVPRSETRHSRALHLLIVAGVLAVVLAAGRLSDRFWHGFVAAFCIASGEVWILNSEVRPVLVRLLVGALCIFILMYAVF